MSLPALSSFTATGPISFNGGLVIKLVRGQKAP